MAAMQHIRYMAAMQNYFLVWIFLACPIFVSMCRASQSITLDAVNSRSDNVGAFLFYDTSAVAITANGSMDLNTTSAYTGWAFHVNLRALSFQWFNQNHVSTLQLILRGSSDIVSSADASLIISISVGDAQYVSLKINLNNGASNGNYHTMGPQCDVSEPLGASSLLLPGSVEDIVDAEVADDDEPRRTRTSADAATMQSPQDLVSWPIVILLENNAINDRLIVRHIQDPSTYGHSHNYVQACGFSEAFSTGYNIDIFINGDDQYEYIRIDNITVIRYQDKYGWVIYVTWSFIIVMAVILCLAILVVAAAKIHNMRGDKSGCHPVRVDSARWWAPMLYGLQILNFLSDINLAIEITVALSAADYTWKIIALTVAYFFSVLFGFVAYVFNVGYAWKHISNHRIVQTNRMAQIWFEHHQTFFLCLVMICGGFEPVIQLTSSNLFGIALFESGLSRFEVASFWLSPAKAIVLFEGFVQLITQILYTVAIQGVSPSALLALTTTTISIVTGYLSFLMNRTGRRVHDVYYYLEGRIKAAKTKLTPDQTKHIKRRRSLKLDMAKAMIDVYGGTSKANFEVGFTSIRENNFVVRICQLVHEDEVAEKIADDELQKIADQTLRAARAIEPFKEYCRASHLGHRGAVENIVFGHYPELDRSAFELLYHKEYPKENLAELMRQNSNAGDGLAGLQTSADFDNRNTSVVDGFASGMFEEEEADDKHEMLLAGVRASTIQKFKEEQTTVGGAARELIEDREQFNQATQILHVEVGSSVIFANN